MEATRLYDVDEIRQLETVAVNSGISSRELMHRAGKGALAIALQCWPHTRDILVIAGKGNNAGDGYILATEAHQQGYQVTVLQLAPSNELTELAAEAEHACQQVGISCLGFSEQTFNVAVSSASMIVDAILGIGFKGSLRDSYAQAIASINQANKPILAIDVPSGLNAETGVASDDTIHASVTVTFIGLKTGLVTGQAADYCGEIVVDNLNLPDSVYATIKSEKKVIDALAVNAILPQRKKTANKKDFGHVLVVGGNEGMGGAVRMAGEACARVGTGLTSIATKPANTMIVSGTRPELMCWPILEAEQLTILIERATAIIIGPGLGRDQWAAQLWHSVLTCLVPKVVDADALWHLAEHPTTRNDWILTPHPGEAARLLQCSSKEIQANRYQAAREIQHRYGGVCVLKGAGTIIQNQHSTYVCTIANPAMASAGMGDVLSGVIGGLLAQGLGHDQAAYAGVWIHAQAGLFAAKGRQRGLLALDLMPFLQQLVNQ